MCEYFLSGRIVYFNKRKGENQDYSWPAMMALMVATTAGTKRELR